MAARLKVVECLDGYYVTLIADFLHREGVLDELAQDADLSACARRRGWSIHVLTALLEYLSLRSELVIKRKVGFEVARDYGADIEAQHLLDLYVGGFGPCLQNLGSVLRDPLAGHRLVNAARHARAFSRRGSASVNPILIRLVKELELTALVDLGCGSGQLLISMAKAVPELTAMGVDANPNMVEAGQRRITEAALGDRIQLNNGDALVWLSQQVEEVRERLQALVAVSFLNEYFGDENEQRIDSLLQTLCDLLPGRLLLVCDYYSRLGSPDLETTAAPRTLIHDLAQILSGQGIPPPTADAWRAIYIRNKCALIKVYEGESAGVNWFIHLVQLQSRVEEVMA